MKYFGVYRQKKQIFFLFSVQENNRKQTISKVTFFPSHFSFILLGSECLVGIILGVNTGCTLENGLY